MPEPKVQPQTEESEMPMLAGSAAARLAQSILTRLAGPFAHPTASPIRPAALWRQVGRRLGLFPEGRPRQVSGGRAAPVRHADDDGEAPPDLMTRVSRSHLELIWRQKGPHADAEVAENERGISRFGPAALTSSAAVTPAIPQQRPPEPEPQSRVQSGESMEVPTHQVVPNDAPVPPVVVPATVVSVPYEPGPAILAQEPLVAPSLLARASSYISEPTAPINQRQLPPQSRSPEGDSSLAFQLAHKLGDDLNQELIPGTDLIARMARPTDTDIEVPTPARRAEATSQAPTAEEPARTQPTPIAPTVAALPTTSEAQQFPAMPLVPQQGTPRAAQEAEDGRPRAVPRGVTSEHEGKERGPIGKFLDRVVDSLPEPVRRFFGDRDNESRMELESRHEPHQPTTASAAPPNMAPPMPQSQPAELPVSPALPQPAQPPTAPTSSGLDATPLSHPSPTVTTQPSAATPLAPSEVASQQVTLPPSIAAPASTLPAPVPSQVAWQPRADVSQSESQHIQPTTPQPGNEQGSAAAPVVEREVLPDRAKQGRWGSLWTRFFGRGDREEEGARPPAIEMPWARRGRAQAEPDGASRPVDIDSDVPTHRQHGAATTPQVFQSPQALSEISPTSIEQPPLTASQQPQVIWTPASSTSVGGQPDTSLPAEAPSYPAIAPSEPTLSPTIKLDSPPMFHPPAQSVAVDSGQRDAQVNPSSPAGLTSNIQQPTFETSPLPSTEEAPLSQRVEELLRPLVQVEPSPEAVEPLAMPLAPRAARGEADQAYLPDVEPSARPERAYYEDSTPQLAPAPIAPTEQLTSQGTEVQSNEQAALPVQPTADSEQVSNAPAPVPPSPEIPTVSEQQAWQTFAQVAHEVARSHEPVTQTAPMETAAQNPLLSRLLEGPGRIGYTGDAGDLTLDEPRAVPAPLTGAIPDLMPDLTFSHPSPPPRATHAPDSASQWTHAQATGAVDALPSHTTASVPTAPAIREQVAPHYAAEMPAQATAAQKGSVVPSAPLVTQQPLVRPTLLTDSARDMRSGVSAGATARQESTASTFPGRNAVFHSKGDIEMPLGYSAVSMQTFDSNEHLPVPHATVTFGEAESRRVIMRPIEEMLPSIGGLVDHESLASSGETAEQEETDWATMFDALYGQRQSDDRPLAIPYNSFAVPREEAPATPQWIREALGQSSSASAGAAHAAAISMPIPSIPSYSRSSSRPASTFSTPSSTPAWIDNAAYSGYEGTASSSLSDGSAAEADSWASVITDAVSDVGAAAPALALAGEEAGGAEAASSEQPQQSQEGEKAVSESELEDIAESVYSILRRRLAVERERDFA